MDQSSNHKRAFTSLDGIDPDESRTVMQDYDSFINRMKYLVYVQTFIDHCRDAEELYMKGNGARQKISLNHARNIIESNKKKIKNLKGEKLPGYKTSSLLTSDLIMMRLRELQRDE